MNKSQKDKQFDQSEYNKQYNKTHYKHPGLNLQPEAYNIISDYCRDMKISQTKFLTAAARYCIDNAVDIDELLSHL